MIQSMTTCSPAASAFEAPADVAKPARRAVRSPKPAAPAPAADSPATLELLRAMDEYKRNSGRMFPTWSEVLEVLKDLGYEKQGPSCPAALG